MAVGEGIPTNNLDRADLRTEVRGLSLWGMGWPRFSFQNILSLQAEMKSLILSLVSLEAELLFFFLARSLCHGTGAFLEPPDHGSSGSCSSQSPGSSVMMVISSVMIRDFLCTRS